VAYYDHKHRGINETNLLQAVKQAESETLSSCSICHFTTLTLTLFILFDHSQLSCMNHPFNFFILSQLPLHPFTLFFVHHPCIISIHRKVHCNKPLRIFSSWSQLFLIIYYQLFHAVCPVVIFNYHQFFHTSP
jgi:hypothetical protein